MESLNRFNAGPSGYAIGTVTGHSNEYLASYSYGHSVGDSLQSTQCVHSIPTTIPIVPKSSGYDAVRGSTFRVANIRSHPTAAPISSPMTQPAIRRVNAIQSRPQILQCNNLYFICLS